MILIPLLYGDHLPDFHWHVVTVGPQVRPIETPPTPTSARAASGPARTVFQPSPNWNPIQTTHPSTAASGPSLEPPSVGISYDAGAQPSAIIGRTTKIKPPPPVADPPTTKPTGPVHVSGGVQMAKLVKQVIPVYPLLARNVRISGVVHLVGIIGKDGTIRNLQLIDGHPLLARAALDAVAQWVYKPTLLSGVPVEVICPIDVTFTLSH